MFPGVVGTNLFAHASGMPTALRSALNWMATTLARAPDAAADTPVWLAADPEAVGISGQFFGPNRTPVPVPAEIQQAERRAEIWLASQEFIAHALPRDTLQQPGRTEVTS